MLRFQNDYSEGAHPNVLRALCDTNLCSTPGYGLDDDCRRAADAIRARFACPDADVHFLVGGTQTNQLAAAAFLRPWEAMVAADTGHINVHETGAIEATGHKAIAVPGADGKLTPAAIADAAAQHCAAPGVYDEHMVLPRMVYVSDATELGTVYTRAELTALRAACDAHGMYLYLEARGWRRRSRPRAATCSRRTCRGCAMRFTSAARKTACSSVRQWSSSTTRSSRASAAR